MSDRAARQRTVRLADMGAAWFTLVGFAVLALGGAQNRHEDAIDDYKTERTRVLALSGERHLDYGLELRKKGLTLQAAAQILMAVEASQGRNPAAETVLNLMRTYQDEFWKHKLEKPTREQLEI